MLRDDIEHDAEAFARRYHAGQAYDGKSYVDGHLKPVAQMLRLHGFRDRLWQDAGLLHDVIEDCLKELDEQDRYYLIAGKFGTQCAKLVWACSGFGANRVARNANIYNKLIAYPEAKPLKVADRLVNHLACIRGRTSQSSMYLRERQGFELVVREGIPEAMWEHLQDTYELLHKVARDS